MIDLESPLAQCYELWVVPDERAGRFSAWVMVDGRLMAGCIGQPLEKVLEYIGQKVRQAELARVS